MFRRGACAEGQPDIRKRIVMITLRSESGRVRPERGPAAGSTCWTDDGGRADDLALGDQARDLGQPDPAPGNSTGTRAPVTYNGWVTSRRAPAGNVTAHR